MLLPSFLKGLVHRFSWGQFVTLAALSVCAGGLWAFAALVDETLEGETRAFDQAVLLALRHAGDPSEPLGPLWLKIMMRDFTSLGSYAVLLLIGLLALGYILMLRKWLSALLLVISFAGSMVLNNLLKQGFDRPRPELVSHLADVYTASFPSGHAMLSATCYLTLGTLLAGVTRYRRLKAYILGCAIAIVLVIGISRVYLGVHWPTDVLAGWALGAAWAMGCWLLLRAWLGYRALRQRRG
ncbi:phosphatase PAP2 family protein [Roseomonas sp. M0104]|uniref:Phosphatase PAP2 family protein n=1 Tax=Teichococcus coralli TaxID=2545983 RepID=A0A845BBC5_9PROT|nr:phosphatase PAP2 family protein [Pseudoroseomonas coralli]MXP64105.1 phosphatase PAP2 family protein [Pseudoroseomonas coralli]